MCNKVFKDNQWRGRIQSCNTGVDEVKIVTVRDNILPYINIFAMASIYVHIGSNVSNVTSGNYTDLTKTSAEITIVTSVFSLVGATLIFVSHCLVSELRRYESRKLLLFLTVADFLTAVGNLLGALRYFWFQPPTHLDVDRPSDNLCLVQSFITTFSSMSSFFWTLVIAFHLLAIVKWQSRGSSKLSFLYHVICWVIPGEFVSHNSLHCRLI